MTARSYDVGVVALTIDAPVKWVDNLLSHHDVPGCVGSRQGVARRISDVGLLAIAIVRMLAMDAGVPVARGVELVRAAAGPTGIGSLKTESGLRIDVPRTLAADLQERLRDALQAVPRRPRGRPPLQR